MLAAFFLQLFVQLFPHKSEKGGLTWYVLCEQSDPAGSQYPVPQPGQSLTEKPPLSLILPARFLKSICL